MAAIFSLLVSFLLFGSCLAKLPKAQCSIKDRNFNTCLKDSINNLVPQLAKEGIPEVNLQPLDPLLIKEYVFTPPDEKMMEGRMSLKDIVVKGLVKTKIISVKSQLNTMVNQTLELKLFNPKLVISGKYDGFLILSPITFFGNGTFSIELTGIEVTGKLIADSLKGKNNKHYFTVKSVELPLPHLNHSKVSLYDNTNMDLIESTLHLVNTYWHSYFMIFYPVVKPHVQNLIKEKINQFTTKIPTDHIVKP